MSETRSYLFTSESVTEGHPDKICDQVSDAILDAILSKETKLSEEGYQSSVSGGPANVENVRCAIETFTTTGIVTVMGEVRTQAYVDVDAIVRDVVRSIGYTSDDFGFNASTCAVANYIHPQSPDIAMGVDESYEVQQGTVDGADAYDRIGAGDQGVMFGYACNETSTLMPLPIFLAHRLAERLTEVRKDGTLPYLRPDGKTQVTVRYEDDVPVRVEKVLISTQHAPEVEVAQIKADLIANVIAPVFAREGVEWDGAEVFVNPTGRFVVGGPMGDTGLTGRKKIVAAGLADRCEIELAYAIGVAHPLSIYVNTFGTAKVDEGVIEKAVSQVFDLRPAAIIDRLQLRRPIYRLTSKIGRAHV